ncbi:MAG: ADP-forming succinate--CoA ligase subunit beta [Candidatus Dormibacter sp.]|uniref:ADP-forming succinate--CoA ligase subunit beta n=1 Tax=Candidatus Dormibacter sp. TaxID=2973982 RepID=UPI000DB2FF06|nr:MAG: ADP-forming succinate--CoA ligase subunit beta [Candidatus Dormibacteraeota bacterium]
MKLLEYQAKEVLSQLGIPIPSGKVATTPDEAARACAELGPVAVKAQVPVGGRGKAGGIKLVQTADEARAAAEQIIGMDIKGFRVPLVYCETALDIAQEVYLGFTVDRDARANVVMLSAHGGMDIEQLAEESPEAIARLYPNPWRGPLNFELNQLVWAAGLGSHSRALVPVIRQLYRAITDYDAVTAEINPLVISKEGQVVAGDAKLETDENAAFRHKALEERYGDVVEGDPYEREAKKRNLTYVSLDGEVGIIGNGAGLCMGTLDLVQRAGGRAANFCDIGGGAKAEVVENALSVILMNPNVRGVLINVFGGITRGDEVARGLVQARDSLNLRLPLVVRLSGTNETEGREILRANGIEPGASGWEAAQKIVEMTR